MLDLLLTILTTAFWIALHFGVGFFVTSLPEALRKKIFNASKPFFFVSDTEMRFYRRIKLAKWKDKLPQYNRDFEKRHLQGHITQEYLEHFILVTCQSEIIHYLISGLGFLSLLFCLLCPSPGESLWIFLTIAAVIALANLPFSLIQRYNRKRLIQLQTTLIKRQHLL